MFDSYRVGDWIQTYTGIRFYPLDPRPMEIDLADIAHALSLQCRFAGHCQGFYSVAQHSVLVARICPEADRRWGLLHDAAEAYLVDLPRPIKRALGRYQDAEWVLMQEICARFGLIPGEPERVRWADDTLLATEARDLMGGERGGPWSLTVPPLADRITGWPPQRAEEEFLAAAAAYGVVR